MGAYSEKEELSPWMLLVPVTAPCPAWMLSATCPCCRTCTSTSSRCRDPRWRRVRVCSCLATECHPGAGECDGVGESGVQEED